MRCGYCGELQPLAVQAMLIHPDIVHVMTNITPTDRSISPAFVLRIARCPECIKDTCSVSGDQLIPMYDAEGML